MSKPKLTAWFPARIKPIRLGVYQRDYGSHGVSDPLYCDWDGKRWGAWSLSPAHALGDKESVSQTLRWRGLASDPKAAA